MLLATVERAVSELGLGGRHVLVAVSGGVDSTVLLHALAEIAPRHELTLSVGHVHHGLRGAEADADAEAARAAATRLGVAFMMERVDPDALRANRSNRERPTLQEAARALRYAALGRIAKRLGAVTIATAHNLDDQAETVLMRLFRGSGPSGLGGIPERTPDGAVVRPLLEVRREEIEAWARSRDLCWREDATNQSDAYTRNRLRGHWIPELAKDFNPQILRAIGQLAEAQRRESEWIDGFVAEQAERMWERAPNGSLALRREGWEDMPEALARRLVQRAFSELDAGRDLSRRHLIRTLAFLRGHSEVGRALELPGGLRLLATRDGFTLSRIQD